MLSVFIVCGKVGWGRNDEGWGSLELAMCFCVLGKVRTEGESEHLHVLVFSRGGGRFVRKSICVSVCLYG